MTTRLGCSVMKSTMTTSSRDWVGSSKICHHAHPAQSPSTPQLVRQARLVFERFVFEYSLCCSSRAHLNCLMQDDLAKFVSDPASPPRLVDIPEEGNAVRSARVTTPSPLKIRPMRRTGRHFRSGSSCGPGSAVLDCPMCPSSMILRLAWRLVSLHRQGGRAMWHASASPRN
jgi:hypothetical protein